MAKLKITGKELMDFGFEPGKVMGVALRIVNKEYKHSSIEEVEKILKEVLSSPEDFVDDEILGPIAEVLIPPVEPEQIPITPLNEKKVGITIYGLEGIEKATGQDIAKKIIKYISRNV